MSTILVTGASGGIGAEVARLVSARGVPVAVHYLRNKKAAEELVTEIASAGGRALAIQADLGREQDGGFIPQAGRRALTLGLLAPG
jgi:NAD(P)-dependent dehydrogenase (short-subunit alcohol dehydrogenase family)